MREPAVSYRPALPWYSTWNSSASNKGRTPTGKPEAAELAQPLRKSGIKLAGEVRLVHEFLQRLERGDAHFLAGGLRLEHHLFAVERVDALARLGGGLLDDLHLQKS